MSCSRRTILRGLLAAGALPFLDLGCMDSGTPSSTGKATSCGANLCIDLADPANADLKNIGGSLYFDAAGDTILVIRTAAEAVVAVSAICTHQGCTVELDSGAGLLVCPCHGSEFAETGRVVQGPARVPLRSYTATLLGTEITVQL